MTVGALFHPDARACKHCDLEIRLDPRMREGDEIRCICSAKGKLYIFACAEPGCDCGGWWGILWEGISYAKRRDTGPSILEIF